MINSVIFAFEAIFNNQVNFPLIFHDIDALTPWKLGLHMVIYQITLRTAAPGIAGFNLEFRFQDMFQVGRTVKFAETGGSANLPS